MKTYLVRTIEDQVLIGVFCEKSKKALIETISPLIEAQDCEYIVLNEGGRIVRGSTVCVRTGRWKARKKYCVLDK